MNWQQFQALPNQAIAQWRPDATAEPSKQAGTDKLEMQVGEDGGNTQQDATQAAPGLQQWPAVPLNQALLEP